MVVVRVVAAALLANEYVSGQMNSCCPNREGENTRNAVCVREFTFWLQFINDKNEISYKGYFCVS